MYEDELVTTKSRILELFAELEESEVNHVEQWISSQSFKKALEEKKNLLKTEQTLVKIGNAIKKLVPFEAEMSSEKIIPPAVGDQADCNSINTCHVDEFLYDQEEVENLHKKGKLKKYYCLNCNSRNIKELIYTSHSMSRQALQYIFKVLLPSDLNGKQILDVGSRWGTVLYGAYYLSTASTIVGVEMNRECCELQENIIHKFTMNTNRIKIVNSDVLERPDIVAQSDVVVINVLDFFVDIEKHKEIWYFFKKHMKKDSFLICNRSLADTLDYLGLAEEFMDWLNICKPYQIGNEIFFDVEDCNELFLYTVK